MTPTKDVRERIARAICKSRTCEGFMCCQWPASGGRLKCPVDAGGYNAAADAARSALTLVDHIAAAEASGTHCIVPTELTETMIQAALAANAWQADGTARGMAKIRKKYRERWDAMLAARPRNE